MAILVFGAGGQVGRELIAAAGRRGEAAVARDRAACDIRDPRQVAAAVAEAAPDLIVNAAGYTAVDRAESDEAAAFAVNAEGAGNVARAAAAAGVPVIQISSDYVFRGDKAGAYVPDDALDPLGAYGRSKAEGEAAVRAAGPRHLIVRASWVFARRGENFVNTMLALSASRPVLRVVADQRGCPTPAADLAAALLRAGEVLRRDEDGFGTHHFRGAPPLTWADFAAAIMAAAGRDTRIEPVSTADYGAPAPRPRNGVLDCRSFAARFGVEPADWRPALADMVNEHQL